MNMIVIHYKKRKQNKTKEKPNKMAEKKVREKA